MSKRFDSGSHPAFTSDVLQKSFEVRWTKELFTVGQPMDLSKVVEILVRISMARTEKSLDLDANKKNGFKQLAYACAEKIFICFVNSATTEVYAYTVLIIKILHDLGVKSIHLSPHLITTCDLVIPKLTPEIVEEFSQITSQDERAAWAKKRSNDLNDNDRMIIFEHASFLIPLMRQTQGNSFAECLEILTAQQDLFVRDQETPLFIRDLQTLLEIFQYSFHQLPKKHPHKNQVPLATLIDPDAEETFFTPGILFAPESVLAAVADIGEELVEDNDESVRQLIGETVVEKMLLHYLHDPFDFQEAHNIFEHLKRSGIAKKYFRFPTELAITLEELLHQLTPKMIELLSQNPEQFKQIYGQNTFSPEAIRQSAAKIFDELKALLRKRFLPRDTSNNFSFLSLDIFSDLLRSNETDAACHYDALQKKLRLQLGQLGVKDENLPNFIIHYTGFVRQKINECKKPSSSANNSWVDQAVSLRNWLIILRKNNFSSLSQTLSETCKKLEASQASIEANQALTTLITDSLELAAQNQP